MNRIFAAAFSLFLIVGLASAALAWRIPAWSNAIMVVWAVFGIAFLAVAAVGFLLVALGWDPFK